MAKYKVGDSVKFKDGGDQWAFMCEIKILKVNSDGTYNIIGKNPGLKRKYGTDLCCCIGIREDNLERTE